MPTIRELPPRPDRRPRKHAHFQPVSDNSTLMLTLLNGYANGVWRDDLAERRTPGGEDVLDVLTWNTMKDIATDHNQKVWAFYQEWLRRQYGG